MATSPQRPRRLPAETLVALQSLEPLRAGQTAAKESRRVEPVDIEHVRATAKHLSPPIRAMLRVQLGTAMRPSEIFKMRPMDIDRSGEVWVYRPESHKNSHRGKSKAVPIASHLGLSISQYAAPIPKPDIIAEVCKDKRMPVEAFMQFKPEIVKRGRGKQDCARVPVYDETGQAHSHFDFVPGHKGFNARGKGSQGLFFPGRLPQPGETWHIVEGCKDAAALVGLGFNACGLPTSYMDDKYAGLFRGVDVVVVPDLDTAGQSGSQRSGGHLKGIAASVRIARLTTGDDDAAHRKIQSVFCSR